MWRELRKCTYLRWKDKFFMRSIKMDLKLIFGWKYRVVFFFSFHMFSQYGSRWVSISYWSIDYYKNVFYVFFLQGCKLRSHSPKLVTNEDRNIQAIVDRFPNLIKVKCTKDSIAFSAENYDDVGTCWWCLDINYIFVLIV